MRDDGWLVDQYIIRDVRVIDVEKDVQNEMICVREKVLYIESSDLLWVNEETWEP